MLDSIINFVGVLFTLASMGVLSFGAYRAIVIGRVLIRGIYRNRAFWTGAVMAVGVIANLLLFLASGNQFPLFLVGTVAVLFIFIDSSIKVAQDTDFFHRSILAWQRLRNSLYVVLLGSSMIGFWAFVFTSMNTIPTFLAGAQYFAIVGLLFSYSAAALIVSARRTPDRTMRRFVRMLGLAIACFVIYLTIWIPFSPFSVTVQDLGNTISYFFVAGASYYLYRAVMSLSPVGHIEKETA